MLAALSGLKQNIASELPVLGSICGSLLVL